MRIRISTRRYSGTTGRSRKKRRVAYVGTVLLISLVVCMLVIIVFSAAGNTDKLQYTQTETEESELLMLNGEAYIPKKNIETYLLMGIDDPGKVQKREEYDGTGQCDVVMLLVRDKSAGTYRTLALNRNTMMQVKSISPDGTCLATTQNQLALAHSDGDGLEISCENVVDAVSNFLYGQKIDGYAAVNMGSIGIINHQLGGVTVTIQDDFSKLDPTMKLGETITLSDEQAVTYVRGRMNIGSEENTERMRRQSEYLSQAEEKFREKCAADSKFPLQVYESLEEYMVTNISSQKFSKIALLVAKEKSEGSLKLEGETVIGEMDFEEFWADQESLESVIAQLFYKKYE